MPPALSSLTSTSSPSRTPSRMAVTSSRSRATSLARMSPLKFSTKTRFLGSSGAFFSDFARAFRSFFCDFCRFFTSAGGKVAISSASAISRKRSLMRFTSICSDGTCRLRMATLTTVNRMPTISRKRVRAFAKKRPYSAK